MLSQKIFPRITDTDAIGHINNTAIAVWLEEGRIPIFKIFNPSFSVKTWNLILVHVEINYLQQTYYGHEVMIYTKIAKIGNSSLDLVQEVFQKEEKKIAGKVTLVHFDYQQQKSIGLPEEIKTQLLPHLIIPHEK